LEGEDSVMAEAQPTFRLFVSYAHKDAKLKNRLLDEIKPLLASSPRSIEVWTDVEIRSGDEWRRKIDDALKDCDCGLLLVSPEFAASAFIKAVELPYLLGKRPIIPVLLRDVPIENLGRLSECQLFRHKEEAFDKAHKGDFALALHGEILEKAGKLPATRPLARELAELVREFDETSWTPTQAMSMDRDSRPVDAIETLMEWLRDPQQPLDTALLGEYGMGKTTTCKALARELLRRREAGESVPLPIFLDLGLVGERAKSDPSLSLILQSVIESSWRAGGTALTPDEIVRLVQRESTLVIWDGLDEVLVHLTPNAGQQFTRQLFRFTQPREDRARILISCRTEFFRTFPDPLTHRDPLVLLPFTRDQIRQYVTATLPQEDPANVMEVLDSVHNLAELAERPYTLSLIAQQFGRIERWKAEGRAVTGLTLHRSMVLDWLERDVGRHQLTKDHKQEFMERLAAELWRSGRCVWSVKDEAEHYVGEDRALLNADLRTATFVARVGEEGFRFAHTSLREFFLAGYLRRALVEGRVEDLALPRVSRETLDFLGQWLLEDPERDAAVATLGRIRDSYIKDASELAFEYVLLAARRGYPAPAASGFQLPGVDLSFREIDGMGVPLAGINLRGARLWNTWWRNCDLRGARLEGSDAARSEWESCDLSGVGWGGLEAALFRNCQGAPPENHGHRTRVVPASSPPGGRLSAAEGHSEGVNGCA
jgi:hypothetical protein